MNMVKKMMGVGLAMCFGLAVWAGAARGEDAVPLNVQSSVDRGLEFLAAQQDKKTGAWKAPNDGATTAVTSLAVMAFLSRGHVPGQGPYGDLVNKGVDYVLTQQQPNSGVITLNMGQSMYGHGMATVMLCEVYGMVDDERRVKIDAALAKAVKLILDAQRVPKDDNNKGGWRYTPESSDSDISLTGWQLMALRGAANAGAAVPKKALDDGIAYIRRRAVVGGGFSYNGNDGPNQGRTGCGILSLELLGQHLSKEAVAGGDYLMRNRVTGGGDFYYYAVYYCSQAANQLGGKYWDGIYRPLRDALVQSQRQNGSWAGVGNEGQGGDNYATAMAVLGLCVPYRYLPLYQR